MNGEMKTENARMSRPLTIISAPPAMARVEAVPGYSDLFCVI